MESTAPTRADSTLPGAESLAALLSAETAASFTADAWPTAPLVVAGSVTRLHGLADYDVEALIAMDKSHTTASLRTLDGVLKSIRVKADQEAGLHSAGATLAFHRLASPGLRRWGAALERDLRLVEGMIRVNAAASRRAEGFEPRFSTEDQFVCQTRGTQRWRIGMNPEDAFVEPASPRTIDLEPGTVVFLPRGTWHAAEATGNETLQVTVQPGLATLREVLEYVLLTSNALQRRELGGPILRMFEGEKTRAGVDDKVRSALRDLVDGICTGELAISPDGLRKYLRARRVS